MNILKDNGTLNSFDFVMADASVSYKISYVYTVNFLNTVISFCQTTERQCSVTFQVQNQ